MQTVQIVNGLKARFVIKIRLVIAALALAAPLAAQAADTSQDPVRPQGSAMELRIAADLAAHLDSSLLPYTHEGDIIVAPGEILTFHFDVKDGVLGAPQFVSAAKDGGAWLASPCVQSQFQQPVPDAKVKTSNPMRCRTEDLALTTGGTPVKDAPPGTLVIRYGQNPKGLNMALILEDNLPFPVRYDPTIEIPQPPDSEFKDTTACPVRPNLPALEQWPYAIMRIIISKMRAVPADDTICQ